MKTEIRTCPECGREIIVKDGRFTQHTDKRRWNERRPPQCVMVGKLVDGGMSALLKAPIAKGEEHA